MEETTYKDIRRVLKTFGIQADEAIVAHLTQHPQVAQLRIRLVLEDVTDYGDTAVEKLSLSVEGEINR